MPPRKKSPEALAKNLAQEAESKAATLAVATEVLSSRVQTLADVVQTNNYKIDKLQKEVNRKPDDTELKWLEEQARLERIKAFRGAVSTGIIAALVAASVAYTAANRAGLDRCEANEQNIETLVSIIDTPMLRKQYADQIADLRSNRNVC